RPPGSPLFPYTTLFRSVATYSVAAGFMIQTFELRGIERVQAGSLITTVILSLLMSFLNRAAYQRWWEARGLWGQLTNDSRNFARSEEHTSELQSLRHLV